MRIFRSSFSLVHLRPVFVRLYTSFPSLVLFFHPFFPLNISSFASRGHLSPPLRSTGYPLENADLTGTEAAVYLPGDNRETVVSWRKCGRKVDARAHERSGHSSVASGWTCVASGISSENTHTTLLIGEIARIHSEVLSNIVFSGWS